MSGIMAMMCRYILLCTVFVLCSSCQTKGHVQLQNSTAAQGNDSCRPQENVSRKESLSQNGQAKIDALMQRAMQANTFPGCVVLVAHGDNVIFRKAYGYSCLTPKIEKMTCETLFDVASMTKCVATAPVIMRLIQDGYIRLDDPVKKYIKDFKPWSNGSETVDITVQQLLTHSSGLDAGLSMNTVNRLRSAWGKYDSKKFLAYIASNARRNFRPGTSRLYSCLNFIVLQGIAEEVTQQPLCLFAENNVFSPLGMHSSRFFLDGDQSVADYSIAATECVNGRTLKGSVHDPLARILNGGNSGNAGLFTTADELARYCFFILNGNDNVLRRETIDKMVAIPSGDERIGRALGWEVNSSYCGSLKKDYCICHTGYTGTSIVIDLDSKVSIILLTNRVHPKDSPVHKKELMNVRRELSDIVASCMKE